MTAPHRVARATVELEGASDRALHRWSERLYAVLPRVMEEVFDGVAETDRPIRIERLEVDLGPIDEREADSVLAERFRQSLARAVQEALPRVGLGASAERRGSPAPGRTRGAAPTALDAALADARRDAARSQRLHLMAHRTPAGMLARLRRSDLPELVRALDDAALATLAASALAPASAARLRRAVGRADARGDPGRWIDLFEALLDLGDDARAPPVAGDAADPGRRAGGARRSDAPLDVILRRLAARRAPVDDIDRVVRLLATSGDGPRGSFDRLLGVVLQQRPLEFLRRLPASLMPALETRGGVERLAVLAAAGLDVEAGRRLRRLAEGAPRSSLDWRALLSALKDHGGASRIVVEALPDQDADAAAQFDAIRRAVDGARQDASSFAVLREAPEGGFTTTAPVGLRAGGPESMSRTQLLDTLARLSPAMVPAFLRGLAEATRVRLATAALPAPVAAHLRRLAQTSPVPAASRWERLFAVLAASAVHDDADVLRTEALLRIDDLGTFLGALVHEPTTDPDGTESGSIGATSPAPAARRDLEHLGVFASALEAHMDDVRPALELSVRRAATEAPESLLFWLLARPPGLAATTLVALDDRAARSLLATIRRAHGLAGQGPFAEGDARTALSRWIDSRRRSAAGGADDSGSAPVRETSMIRRRAMLSAIARSSPLPQLRALAEDALRAGRAGASGTLSSDERGHGNEGEGRGEGERERIEALVGAVADTLGDDEASRISAMLPRSPAPVRDAEPSESAGPFAAAFEAFGIRGEPEDVIPELACRQPRDLLLMIGTPLLPVALVVDALSPAALMVLVHRLAIERGWSDLVRRSAAAPGTVSYAAPRLLTAVAMGRREDAAAALAGPVAVDPADARNADAAATFPVDALPAPDGGAALERWIAERLDALLDGRALPASAVEELDGALRDRRGDALRRLVVRRLAARGDGAALAARWPDGLRITVLELLHPSTGAELVRVTDALVVAADFSTAARLDAVRWTVLFRHRGRGVLEDVVRQLLFAWRPILAAERTRAVGAAGATLEARLATGLRRVSLPLRPELRGRLLDVLLGADEDPVDAPLEAIDAVDGTERVALAGVVLAAPYLPRLFDQLGLVRGGAFVDASALERGVQALHVLGTGEAVGIPDRRLARLLCGVPDGMALGDVVLLTDAERELVDGLARALIENWGALGSTSVAGLREAFLDRPGRLEAGTDGWRLQVEPRAFDMLLDRLPWSFSVIRYRWMSRPVFVEWR